ncbi:MAG: hypothetical protein EKK56_05970 [Flavobacteriaceae bacterium]|nr:MAG: hypothetical protein EKK56_05970 [Flavobacteriaceae bacterium]
MKKVILLIILIQLSSCKTYTKFNTNELSQSDTIYHLDLSNKNLKTQPDLSKFTIIELNISKNRIATFEENKLPKGIKKLNFSHNKISKKVIFKEERDLESVNFSNNKMKSFFYPNGIIKNLNLSNNKLVTIQMPLYNDKRADTLNVANNPKLETTEINNIGFPRFYKTLINFSINTKN